MPEPGVHGVLTGGIQPVPPKETCLFSTVRKWGVFEQTFDGAGSQRSVKLVSTLGGRIVMESERLSPARPQDPPAQEGVAEVWETRPQFPGAWTSPGTRGCSAGSCRSARICQSLAPVASATRT